MSFEDKLRSYPNGFTVKNLGYDGIFLYNPRGNVIFTNKCIERGALYLAHQRYSVSELKAILTFVEEYK